MSSELYGGQDPIALHPGQVNLDKIEAFYSRIDTDRGRSVIALVAEARAGRLLAADARQVRAKVAAVLVGAAAVYGPRTVEALRGIHTDLDTAIAAHAEAVS